ncbi:NADH-quinone oxidoreductase subunit G [compost metagenome]
MALAKAEAERLGLGEGALLSLSVDGQALRLPLQVRDELAVGLIGLPVGLPGIPRVIAGALATALAVTGAEEAAL